MPLTTYDKITLETFRQAVARYPVVAPKNARWRDNDEVRYEIIPKMVEKRRNESDKKDNVHLKKCEVVQLMEWKL